MSVPDGEIAVPPGEGGLDRIEGAADRILVVIDAEPVHQQHPFVLEVVDVLQGFFHLHVAAFARGQARESFFLETEQLLDLAVFLPADVGQDQDRRALFQRTNIIHHILGGVAADFAARDGGVGLADAGEEQAQVVVDFRRSPDGRAGIAGGDLLLDGDGRRDACDQVHVGLVHPAQELAGERREAFREAALPLGEKCVEGQRTLAAAGDARDDHEFPERDVQIDILQVVNPGASYVYLLFLHLLSCCPSDLSALASGLR